MHKEIIFSGFGGQGALFVGQLITYAGMHAGWEVTWIPSYGPEMRGGTAHCTVILSDQPIGSPLIRNPTIAVALNPESMTKYEPLVRPGGLLVVNSAICNARRHHRSLCPRERPGVRAGQCQDGQRRSVGGHAGPRTDSLAGSGG